MFEKILIANRGEIACRIIKTAKKLGILSVVVYSEADAQSQAVQLADEAYYIGKSPSTESYLRGEQIIEIAQQTGAQAIHPGYGFLSENAQFARACEKANIIFIGPSAAAIETMGSKSAAKSLVETSNIPVTPGYHGKNQDPVVLLTEAQRIGFPILLKATAGGGGKGMRAVFEADAFAEALAGAKREAQASFGDETMLIEKYLINPRHIEIQIFRDHQGNAVYLFERDCSIQRRHQKVLEEAPASHFPQAVREAMGNAAVQIAKNIGYVGAGTIEFLLDKNHHFYFMEMNTRLQVEHPITEMITHQDLVEWQLRVASGEPLPCQQADLMIHGHAIEARIYAEDPENQFLPSIGTLTYFQTPPENAYIRVDTGFKQYDSISPYYDPMMAKLIVWGEDRATAIRRLHQALSHYHIIGVKSNIAFLKKLIQHPAFKAGNLSTGFIETYQQDLHHPAIKSSEHIPYLILASLYHITELENAAIYSMDPWNQADTWKCSFIITDTRYAIQLKKQQNNMLIYINQNTNPMIIPAYYYNPPTQSIYAEIHQRMYQARIVKASQQIHLLTPQQGIITIAYDNLESTDNQDSPSAQTNGQLIAPMPGLLVALNVEIGQIVKTGQHLAVIEAMKMEHTLCAPHAGTVKEIYFSVGQQVGDGEQLMTIQ